MEPGWLAGVFARGPTRHFVLLEADTEEPIGLFGLRVRTGTAHLLRIALAPEWRGAGLARPLLRAAERLARDAGVSRMTLNVYGDNEPARRAYEAAGFFVNEFAEDSEGEVVRMTKPLGAAAAA